MLSLAALHLLHGTSSALLAGSSPATVEARRNKIISPADLSVSSTSETRHLVEISKHEHVHQLWCGTNAKGAMVGGRLSFVP